MAVKISSFPDIVHDWEGLLTATEESPELAAAFESQRVPLKQTLEEARSLKALQTSHAAAKQETTRQLKAVLVRGRDLAIHLRAALKGTIGPRSEELVKFGVSPLRKRSRRSDVAVKKAKGVSSSPTPETVE